MQTLISFQTPQVSSDNVSKHIDKLMKLTGASASVLAQGMNIPEPQFNRMARKKSKFRAETLKPIERVEILLQEALKTLTPVGVKHWLMEPNPYLNDVPPILCMRSDKEMEKVLSLLVAIRHGFPA